MDTFAEIYKSIKRIRNRLVFNKILNYSLLGGTAGLFVGGMINFFAIWFPIADAMLLGIAFGLLGVMGGMAWAIMKGPTLKQAALWGDARGMKESLITALERREKQDILSVAQREQTKKRLNCFSISKEVPVRGRISYLLCFMGTAFCMLICILIPSQAKEIARERKELSNVIEEQVGQIEALKEELLKEQMADAGEMETLMELLKQTMEELDSMENPEEKERIMERLSMKLEKEEERMQSPDFSRMADMTQEALSLPQMKEEQEQSLSSAIQEQLQEYMEKQALESGEGQLKEEGELGQISEQLAEMMGQMKPGQLSGELSELSGELSEISGELSMSEEELVALLKDAQASLSEGRGSDSLSQKADGSVGGSGSQNGGSENGQSGNQGAGGSGNDGGGSGAGGSGNDGSGSGAGGAGSGGGGIGGGYNTGSKNGFERIGIQESSMEELNIPNSVGEDENLTGAASGSGSYFIQTEQGLAWNGEKKDYRQVTGEYTQEAYRKINNPAIPEAVRDIVKDYFSGLAE